VPNAKIIDKKLVLVIDDDHDSRESMADILDLRGYSAVQAENGQNAFEILKTMLHFPSLILLDLAMPIMDGHEFLKLRARDPILFDIPVVVVSGSLHSGAALEGVEAYLCKPVNIARLVRIVEHYS
jgi:two-component system, chemotaxis family, chemotaxis protein CheY